MCENTLSAEECLEIYNHVSKSERVVQIDLSQNQIGHVFHGEGRNPGTFTKLLSCRPRFTNLKHLNLSRNVMNVMCVERQKAFFKALERNKNLETLNLSRNDLEQSACVRLGRVLQHNRVLKCLDLSWNNFKDASALCLDRSVLEELDLSYNNISNARNFDSFTKSLRRNQTLCHLNLCGNRLDPKAIASLALCVRKNTRLLGLHVEENQGGTISSFGFVKCVETRNLSPCHIPYTTCWICARYRVKTIVWTPPVLGDGCDYLASNLPWSCLPSSVIVRCFGVKQKQNLFSTLTLHTIIYRYAFISPQMNLLVSR